jgi:type IV secretory pathway VirB2 component (pilin)
MNEWFFLPKNPTGFEDLQSLILNAVNIAMSLSVVIAIAALIIAGFQYILAIGNEEKVEKATKSLIFALVGLVIVFMAPLAVEYITSFLTAK